MPRNKNAEFRFLILDRCFSDYHHKYTIEDLLEKVNDKLYDANGNKSMIMERQLRSDLNAIRKMLPNQVYLEAIPFDNKKCYYRYSDPNFSIYKNELSVSEIQNLRSTIEMLGKYRGLPSNEWMNEVISNLEWRFGLHNPKENFIGFEQNPYLKGLHFLPMLINATTNHQAIKITYRNYKNNEEEHTFTVHPWYLKQYNNRWFLMAYEADTDRISNFALDRIQDLQIEKNVTYIPNVKIDFEHYFDDVFGVTIPPEGVRKIRVVLQFSPKQYPYITSKPLHHSQEIVDEKNCILAVEIRPNYEFTQLILSFGRDVKVLEPESYRQEIIANIEQNLQNYHIMQIDCTDK